MAWKKLTPDEERVIINKGTEAPFSGEYEQNFKPGVYVCKRCGAPLYRSDDKFDASCGWPSFDQEIRGAVKRVPPDRIHMLLGAQDELQCTRCGAFLGHLFIGEGFTKTDKRHCVNSISLRFIPAKDARHGKQK